MIDVNKMELGICFLESFLETEGDSDISCTHCGERDHAGNIINLKEAREALSLLKSCVTNSSKT